jgi:glycosyl hydrolase family 65
MRPREPGERRLGEHHGPVRPPPGRDPPSSQVRRLRLTGRRPCRAAGGAVPAVPDPAGRRPRRGPADRRQGPDRYRLQRAHLRGHRRLRRPHARGNAGSRSSWRRRGCGRPPATTTRTVAGTSTGSPAPTSTRPWSTTTSSPTCWRRGAGGLAGRRGAVCLPYDADHGVHPQCENFTRLQEWDFAGSSNNPLMRQATYFQLYRHQVVKQADLVLAMQWCPESFTGEEKARNLDYYEPRTVRDSSLSAGSQARSVRRGGAPGARPRPPARGGPGGPPRPAREHGQRAARRLAGERRVRRCRGVRRVPPRPVRSPSSRRPCRGA